MMGRFVRWAWCNRHHRWTDAWAPPLPPSVSTSCTPTGSWSRRTCRWCVDHPDFARGAKR